MPTVTRTQPPVNNVQPTVKKTGGILDRAIPIAEHQTGGLKVCLYGRNGSGKTTLACKFPKPLLLLGFEDGTKSVRTVPGVNFIRVLPSRGVEDQRARGSKIPMMGIQELEQLAQEIPISGYKTVVVDTVTALQDVVFAEMMGLTRVPVQWGGGVKSEVYYARADETKKAMQYFVDMSDVWGINIVFLAQEKDHSKGEGRSAPISDEFASLLVPFIGASLGRANADWLHSACDYVCQTFAREKTVQVERELAGEKTVEQQRTGEPEFCLRTQRGNRIYAAKVRADEKANIPEIIVNPQWADLVKWIGK